MPGNGKRKKRKFDKKKELKEIMKKKNYGKLGN